MSTDTIVKNGWYTDKYGNKIHYKNNLLHCEDGPAVIYSDESKAWYINGNRHREDGPAVIYSNGYKAWYINDKLHRKDGPAIIDNIDIHNYKAWYINGKEYTFKDYCKELSLSQEQILKLTLKYNL